MSMVSKRSLTIHRHEYWVPSPACRADVEKAIDWALSELPEHRRGWDDDVMVEARDDEIVVTWSSRDGDPT